MFKKFGTFRPMIRPISQELGPFIVIKQGKSSGDSKPMVLDPIFGNNDPVVIDWVSQNIIAQRNLTPQQMNDLLGWSVGDIINVDYKGDKVGLRIIDVNHYVLAGDTKKAGLTLEFVNIPDKAPWFKVSPPGNASAWSFRNSDLYNVTLQDVYNNLPKSIQGVIKKVTIDVGEIPAPYQRTFDTKMLLGSANEYNYTIPPNVSQNPMALYQPEGMVFEYYKDAVDTFQSGKWWKLMNGIGTDWQTRQISKFGTPSLVGFSNGFSGYGWVNNYAVGFLPIFNI